MTDTKDIVVFCAHDDTRHEVGRLVLVQYRSRPTWDWTLGLVGTSDGNFVGLTAELVDDRALPRFATPEVATTMHNEGRRRERYRFRCECGDTLPAREDKLARCAQKLVGHGESEVSMPTLRRMLALI